MAYTRTLVLLLPLLALSPAQAQINPPKDGVEFDAQLTSRGEIMDYGSMLSYSLISGERGPSKNKKDPGKFNPGWLPADPPTMHLRAINIRLAKNVWAAFDTEMCGWAACWTGGPPDISRTNLNGYKGTDLAYMRMPVIFQNPQQPGWSKVFDSEDPRPAPFGALPKNIAHYKGLYRHGDKVILSYTLGNAKVLELPEVLKVDKTDVFCRTIFMDRLEAEKALFLPELDNAAINEHTFPGGKIFVFSKKNVNLVGGVLWVPQLTGSVSGRGRLGVILEPRKVPFTLKVFIARDVTADALEKIIKANASTVDLPTFCQGGPAQWNKEIVFKGKPGAGNTAYTVDTIPLPFNNPWKSWMRPGGFDFFSDGRAAVCTWNGDVWIVSGLDDKLERVRWRRFAAGLFEPMGLKIVKDQIYVLGRDQITRLHDLNGDGEADYYENFNNDGPTAPTFHSFALELQTDKAGNFYYVRGGHRTPPGTPMHGGVIKVAADGSKAELFCTGIREADGISIGPDDTITLADNQGNWVPTSKIDIIQQGKFYGYQWEKKDYPKPENPLCWIPYSEDNSSGGQVWVTSKKWGPFEGQLLHTSYGTCKLFQVFMQKDGERFQGGVSAFPFTFDSGIHRARFNPVDGQLYLAGLKGWSTTGKDDGCFQRVRYTGKPVYRPQDLRVDKGKIALTFTAPIDLKSAKPQVEQWTYQWTKNYGSKEYSIANPGKVGHDKVTVKGVSLSDDGKTLTLDVPELRPVMQMAIHLKGLRAADGTAMPTTVYNTINYVP